MQPAQLPQWVAPLAAILLVLVLLESSPRIGGALLVLIVLGALIVFERRSTT